MYAGSFLAKPNVKAGARGILRICIRMEGEYDENNWK